MLVHYHLISKFFFFVCVFLKEVSYAHRGYVYLIQNTVKTVILF